MYEIKNVKRNLSFQSLSGITIILMILLFSEFSLLFLPITPTLYIHNDRMALAFKPSPLQINWENLMTNATD